MMKNIIGIARQLPRRFVLTGLALVVVVSGGAILRYNAAPAVAQAPGGPPGGARPPVSVATALAEKKDVPLQVEAIGTVAPIASVALKARVDTTIIEVHFADGAKVAKDDLLFTLDSRQIDAQLKQAEGTLIKDRAQLDGAERDVKRYRDLIAKGATTQVNLDNALTQANILQGTIRADEAAVENFKVQKSYMQIRAPISGRISNANVKAGNFVRPGDTASLATINQMAPVYVAFAVPQQTLPQLREAVKDATARVRVNVPGSTASEEGRVAMIDNSVDAATGMVVVRALIDNAQETLWPGTLVSATLIIRTEKVIAIPSVAVQRSQAGDFVFVVDKGAAKTQPIKIARTLGTETVIAEGLSGGEMVVTDGQLSLSNGARVIPRNGAAPGNSPRNGKPGS